MKKHLKQYYETYLTAFLQSALIILKINNIINWKWIHVLLPSLIYFTIILMLILLAIYVGDK